MVLSVRVVDSDSGLVELGNTPLVVPQFYGLSNSIDSHVLNIRTSAELVCIVRLMTTDTSVPALGQLVREEDSTQRKGTAQLDRSQNYGHTKYWCLIGYSCVCLQAERRPRSVQGTNPVFTTPRRFVSSKPAARTS